MAEYLLLYLVRMLSFTNRQLFFTQQLLVVSCLQSIWYTTHLGTISFSPVTSTTLFMILYNDMHMLSVLRQVGYIYIINTSHNPSNTTTMPAECARVEFIASYRQYMHIFIIHVVHTLSAVFLIKVCASYTMHGHS